jgi:toxin ParE1/3/4
MKRTIRFLAEARDEFDRAIAWYEERGVDLAKDFIARIGAVVRRVAAHPEMHGLVYGDVRKAVVTRFPYVVLYCEEDAGLLVVSAFHTSRDPDEWKSRLA